MNKRYGIIACFLLLQICAHPFNATAQGIRWENVGAAINSPTAADCGPMLSPDGNTMYFFRQTSGKNDIWWSHKGPDGKWLPATELKEFNNENRNEVLAVSADGNTIYLRGQYGASSSDNGISTATRTVNGWSAPKLVAFRQQPSSWAHSSIAFGNNDSVMIISLNGDLYVSKLGTDHIWSKPAPLTSLNTKALEQTPALSFGGRRMYFSSDRKGTFGGCDIYRVTRLDDTWMHWSEPEHLDSTINTRGWETFFTIDPSGQSVYMYSYRSDYDSGGGDIFQIPFKEYPPRVPVQMLAVTGAQATLSDQQPRIHTPDSITPAIVFDSLNSHYYERIEQPGISFADAKAAAEARTYHGMRGHLVTITSKRENEIVFRLGNLAAYHFGGYQDTTSPGFREPNNGWKWVTGEPWDFTAWSPGEPNDGGGTSENYLVGWFGNGWNDGHGKAERGYVVEYEPTTPEIKPVQPKEPVIPDPNLPSIGAILRLKHK